VPEVLDRGHDVVVVVAAMVVVVCSAPVVVGAVEAALLHAAVRSAVAVKATTQGIR
jgi:hypothetical protein